MADRAPGAGEAAPATTKQLEAAASALQEYLDRKGVYLTALQAVRGADGAIRAALTAGAAAPRAGEPSEVARLREALAYYADPENWDKDDWGIAAVIAEYADAGKRAREALSAAASPRGAERERAIEAAMLELTSASKSGDLRIYSGNRRERAESVVDAVLSALADEGEA